MNWQLGNLYSDSVEQVSRIVWQDRWIFTKHSKSFQSFVWFLSILWKFINLCNGAIRCISASPYSVIIVISSHVLLIFEGGKIISALIVLLVFLEWRQKVVSVSLLYLSSLEKWKIECNSVLALDHWPLRISDFIIDFSFRFNGFIYT